MSDTAATFVSDHPRAVLVTRRRDGGLQASPIRVQRDGRGRIVASTRTVTAKARNAARDPEVALCVLDSGWSGPWMTIEGTAELVQLPEALPMLADFYRERDGEIPDEETFAAKMSDEQRVLLVVHPTRHTPLRG